MRFYIPTVRCIISGHVWGPWLLCADGITRRWCNRCNAVTP